MKLSLDLKNKLDTFQLKGLRQILKIPTTYGQMEQNKVRTWTNNNIMTFVHAKLNSNEERKNETKGFLRKTKNIILMSEYYEYIKRKVSSKLSMLNSMIPQNTYVLMTKHWN